MPSHFFGQFLIHRKVISTAQLLQTIMYQKGRNRLLGEMAVERGILTPVQVEVVKAEQLKRDIYFGDAVVSLGYLSQAQVDGLLSEQKKSHLHLGESAVQLGFISEEVLAKALKDFKEEQAAQLRSQEHLIVIPDVPNRDWMEPFVDMAQKTLLRVFGIHSHVGFQTLVKRGNEVPLFRWSAALAVDEPWRGCFIVAAPERVVEAMAQKRSGAIGELVESDAATHDAAIKELASVSCKLTGSLLEKRGLKLHTSAAESQPRTFVLRGSRGLVIELVTPQGALHIVLTFP